jgi:phage baseplate assembly protein W
MPTYPFLGKGVSFPLRVDPNTGGLLVSEGNTDELSVALQYLMDRWTVREEVRPKLNHIAESVAHILLTKPGEYDTLPEFGSYLFKCLFEPNSYEFRFQAETFFKLSTKEWEKRARIPEAFGADNQGLNQNYAGIQWAVTPHAIDEGRVPVWVRIQFISEQADGNMVAPYATPRDARTLKYRASKIDDNGHDNLSRYYGQKAYYWGGIKYVRFDLKVTPSPDKEDRFYTVEPYDSWFSISYTLFGEIRYAHILAENYVIDAAKAGLSRKYLDVTGDPEPGTILRYPSRTTLLMGLKNG